MTPEQRKALAIARAKANIAPAESGIVEQIGSGTSEGVANIAGMPVNIATMGLNLGIAGVNRALGSDFAQIENPVGGSDSLRSLLSPFISDTAPQGAAQRYGRRIGREVGSMAVPAGGAMAKAAKPAAVGLMSMLSAGGAGVGGQTAREIAPNSAGADFVGSLLGGMSPMGLSRAMRKPPSAPSLDELSLDRDGFYNAVERSGMRLNPNVTDDMADGIDAVVKNKLANPRAAKRSTAVGEETIDALRSNPNAKISDVDDHRKIINRDVMRMNPSEYGRDLSQGASMKAVMDDRLNNLTPNDVSGVSNPADVISDLKKGRKLHKRVSKAKMLEGQDTGLIDKAKRRASVSGRGGNELNAVKQNVARILGNEKLRSNFNETELAMMRRITDGSFAENSLRHAGGLSPATGSLQAMAGVGATATNPLASIPFIGGYVAQKTAERMQRNSLDDLLQTIRNGGTPVGPKQASESEISAMKALLQSMLTQQQ